MPRYKNRQCHFCKDKIEFLDYKDIALLRKFLTQYWKIVPSYYSGCCVRHQKMVSKAIKRARTVALIPYMAA